MRGPRPTLQREIAIWGSGGGVVAGLDEAGRGPLAGPVVAAAVVFPPFCKPIRGLRDSKLLAPEQRARLAAVVWARALAVAVGAASVREIDRLNIRRASILAMRRALARRHQSYAWASNKGYGTPEHLAALAAFGFTAHHRRSFSPVVQLELIGR